MVPELPDARHPAPLAALGGPGPGGSAALAALGAEPRGLGGIDLGRALALEAALRVAVVAELGRPEDVQADVAQSPHEAVAQGEPLVVGGPAHRAAPSSNPILSALSICALTTTLRPWPRPGPESANRQPMPPPTCSPWTARSASPWPWPHAPSSRSTARCWSRWA